MRLRQPTCDACILSMGHVHPVGDGRDEAMSFKRAQKVITVMGKAGPGSFGKAGPVFLKLLVW